MWGHHCHFSVRSSAESVPGSARVQLQHCTPDSAHDDLSSIPDSGHWLRVHSACPPPEVGKWTFPAHCVACIMADHPARALSVMMMQMARGDLAAHPFFPVGAKCRGISSPPFRGETLPLLWPAATWHHGHKTSPCPLRPAIQIR